MIIEIKHRHTDAVLFSAEAASIKEALEIAARDGANLSGANLSGADLIDGGQDARGFRFWAWIHDSQVVYRAGLYEWADYDEAAAWYGDDYESDGNRRECLARLQLMRLCAVQRGWIAEEEKAA